MFEKSFLQCTPRQIVVILKKIEYSDNNKMNSVKTKKTDDKILNLENQEKYKNSVDKIESWHIIQT